MYIDPGGLLGLIGVPRQDDMEVVKKSLLLGCLGSFWEAHWEQWILVVGA